MVLCCRACKTRLIRKRTKLPAGWRYVDHPELPTRYLACSDICERRLQAILARVHASQGTSK